MPDPPESVRHYCRQVADRCRATLGGELVAVWLAGSLALDDFGPARSDVDVTVAVAGPMTAAAKEPLVDALDQDSLPCPARGLELVVYRVEQLRSAAAEPAFELELNDGPHMTRRVGFGLDERPETDGRFWYGIDLAVLAQAGRPLLGPPPGELVTAAPPAVLLGLVASSLRWHLGRDRAGEADVVLNACRALHFARSGSWVSKGAAGRLLSPTADVVAQAMRARDGGAAAPERGTARAFARAVLAELDGAAAT